MLQLLIGMGDLDDKKLTILSFALINLTLCRKLLPSSYWLDLIVLKMLLLLSRKIVLLRSILNTTASRAVAYHAATTKIKRSGHRTKAS